ncbi:MAG: RNA polymerase sigma factor [Lachnospiraceae bacterium]|nr:RNA polymerase sigma factor [Lachnospiraceae bacterium]
MYIKTEEEYSEVVERFSDMIFRIAYQNLLNIHDAEDAVQDVFLKLLKQKNKCFHDEEHLKSWLIRITINQCLDYKKAFFRKNTVPLEDLEIPYEQKERELMEELYRLPKEYRNILYLHYYEGYTIKEIAKILGKKQNTVNSKLTRGRNQLKKIMEVENEGEL